MASIGGATVWIASVVRRIVVVPVVITSIVGRIVVSVVPMVVIVAVSVTVVAIVVSILVVFCFGRTFVTRVTVGRIVVLTGCRADNLRRVHIFTAFYQLHLYFLVVAAYRQSTVECWYTAAFEDNSYVNVFATDICGFDICGCGFVLLYTVQVQGKQVTIVGVEYKVVVLCYASNCK